MKRVTEIKQRLYLLDALRVLKKRRSISWCTLSRMTGIAPTTLSRYSRGHILPTAEKARKLRECLNRIFDLKKEVKRRITFDRNGFFDNTSIVFDIPLLRLIAAYAIDRFAGKRITKVLTAAVDGIPLAVMIAHELDVDLAIAKREKEVGVPRFYEVTYSPGGSGHLMSLYLPRGAIKSRDSVLIVDDVIKTGETQRALIELARRAGADIAGVFAIVSIGNAWKRNINLPPGIPVEVLLSL